MTRSTTTTNLLLLLWFIVAFFSGNHNIHHQPRSNSSSSTCNTVVVTSSSSSSSSSLSTTLVDAFIIIGTKSRRIPTKQQQQHVIGGVGKFHPSRTSSSSSSSTSQILLSPSSTLVLSSSSSLLRASKSNNNNNNKRQKHKRLWAAKDNNNNNNNNNNNYENVIDNDVTKIDQLIQDVAIRMKRVSWLSWWVQLILTTISAVTLLFTRNVTDLQGAGMTMIRPILPNYALVGSGIVLSFGSIFWTWATRRLSRRLLRKATTRIQAANMIRKDVTVGTTLNLLGIALLVVGMQQVIGGLAIKVLTTATTASPAVYQSGQALSLLQPLDILVVQANTNALSSHFCGLVAYLYMGRSIGRLDPPSVEGDVRPRG